MEIHCQISREKFEPEPGREFGPLEVRVRVPVQIFLLKSDNVYFQMHKL